MKPFNRSKRSDLRLRRLGDHIARHLDQTLRVDALSDRSGLGKFALQRRFAAAYGLPIAAYVRGLRLKRAAYTLAFRPEVKIIDVALAAGFTSPEAFSRAFARLTGQSPKRFRLAPAWEGWQIPLHILHTMLNLAPPPPVNIVSFPATKVAALEHVGPPSTILQAVGRFIAWRRQHGPSPQHSATWNVFYNDPERTSVSEHRMDICASVAADVAANAFGVVTKVIEGGRCAVLRHRGSDDDLSGRFSWLLHTWLPTSGERLRDAPCFVQRIAFFPDVPQCEAITDLFVPLQAK